MEQRVVHASLLVESSRLTVRDVARKLDTVEHSASAQLLVTSALLSDVLALLDEIHERGVV